MKGVTYSAEIRWFFPRALPDRLVQWFSQEAHLEHEGVRHDRYLLFPSCDTVGVKLREGLIEIKARVAPPVPFNLGPGLSGRTDQWVKWSFSAAGIKALTAARRTVMCATDGRASRSTRHCARVGVVQSVVRIRRTGRRSPKNASRMHTQDETLRGMLRSIQAVAFGLGQTDDAQPRSLLRGRECAQYRCRPVSSNLHPDSFLVSSPAESTVSCVPRPWKLYKWAISTLK
ncbi:MAG: hypothetical protein ACREVK_07080 [Gammaproteobacteria bacterium]